MFDVWLNSTRLVVGGEGGREGSGGWFFERNDFNSSSRLKRKGEHGLLLGDARWILEITNNSFLSLEDFLFFAPFKILLSRLRSRRNLIRAPEIISSRQRQMISTDRFSNETLATAAPSNDSLSTNEDDSFFVTSSPSARRRKSGIVTGSSRFLEVPRKLCRGFQRA